MQAFKCVCLKLLTQTQIYSARVFQMKEGQLTLRISKKNNKDKPKILLMVGKTDKLIKDYLEVYKMFSNF